MTAFLLSFSGTVFQSLLCWITQSFGRYRAGDLAPAPRVSIPVVLDHPVLPCELARREAAGTGFQSLLCWITQSFCRGREALLVGLLFQSLLCWITQSFTGPISAPDRPGSVSIPVVLDHPVLQGDRYTVLDLQLKFQSLLCWITQSFSSPSRANSIARRRFNPCCVGSPSPSRTLSGQLLLAAGFNPCCVGSPSPSPRAPRRPRWPLVSIPVVLDHPVLRCPSGHDRPRPRTVSIPVVLDHPVLRAAVSTAARPSPGFNPCCVGSPSPSPVLPVPEGHIPPVFQSLLCWITQSFFGAA